MKIEIFCKEEDGQILETRDVTVEIRGDSDLAERILAHIRELKAKPNADLKFF